LTGQIAHNYFWSNI